MAVARLTRWLARAGAVLSVVGTAHAAWNLRLLRVPPSDPPPVAEPVAVLLPVRDEAHRVEPCLRSLLGQRGVRDLRVLVLDDGSTDGTAEVVRRVAAGDPRVTVLTGDPLPGGWWGKPWACHQLAVSAGVGAVADLSSPDLSSPSLSSPGSGPSPGSGTGAPPAAACALLQPSKQSTHGRPPPPGAQALLQPSEQSTRGRPPSPAARAPAPAVLVFVDADVVLAPHAVASAVTLLRWSGLDLVSPYPRQAAVSLPERLVQPLLQWSWLTTLPLRVAERSARESLAAANGQFLVVDTAAYQRAGGHGAVRTDLLEDIALLRAVKRAGGCGGVADGTRLATCRMYDGWADLRDGYAKSLWSAFGSPAGAAGVLAGLGLAYVVPPLAALRGSRAGLVGYLAAVVGRVVVGRRVGARVWPDALAHPASILAFGWLTLHSLRLRRRGTVTVRGRTVDMRPSQPSAVDAAARVAP